MQSALSPTHTNETTPKKNILRSVFTVTAFSLVTRTTAFLFKIYLSRTLGAEVMGLYQMALTVFFLFIALSTGGISTVLSRKIAEKNTVNLSGDRLLSTSLFIGVSVSAVCLIVAYLSLPYLDFIITDARAIPLLKIMLPALVSTTFYIIIRGWFWGNKHFFDYSVSELIEEILRVFFTLFLVSGIVSGINGQSGLAIAFTLSDFIVMIVITVMFFRKGGRFSRPENFREILKPAAPLTVMKIFGSFAGTAVALIIPVGLIKSGMSVSEATASVGRISGMANPLLFAPNAVINSLAVVLIPEMSEANFKKDFHSLTEQVSKGIAVSLVLSGLFLAVYSSLGRELTAFLYNDVESGIYLEKASIVLLLMPINLIASSALNSVGLEKKNFLSYATGTVFMFLASVFLPRYLGLNAVIIADVLFLGTTSFMNVLFLQKHLNSSLRILKPTLLVALFALIVSLFGKNIFNITAPVNEIFALVLSGLTVASSYLILNLSFKTLNLKEVLILTKKR